MKSVSIPTENRFQRISLECVRAHLERGGRRMSNVVSLQSCGFITRIDTDFEEIRKIDIGVIQRGISCLYVSYDVFSRVLPLEPTHFCYVI